MRDLESARERLEAAGLAPLLRPAGWAYGLGRAADRASRLVGLRPVRRLPRPVVCVGNLTVGGTGKTPTLVMLARELQSRGLRVAILSRGYGAVPPATEPRVVSRGEGAVVSAAESGDEPALLARALPGVPIAIGANRFEAGRLAHREFAPDLFLLDDGFQHDALARDVDLLLWDARDDPERARLLPEGRLREPLRAAGRATAIVLTHAEYIEGSEEERRERLARVAAELKRRAPRAPVFETRTRLDGVRPLRDYKPRGEGEAPRAASAPEPIATLRGRRAVLVSGLARPGGFEALARAAGVEVAATLRFGDHAKYREGDATAMREAARAAKAECVLTTEKDAVKLAVADAAPSADPPIRVVGLATQMDEPERWGRFLDATLERTGNVRPGVL